MLGLYSSNDHVVLFNYKGSLHGTRLGEILSSLKGSSCGFVFIIIISFIVGWVMSFQISFQASDGYLFFTPLITILQII